MLAEAAFQAHLNAFPVPLIKLEWQDTCKTPLQSLGDSAACVKVWVCVTRRLLGTEMSPCWLNRAVAQSAYMTRQSTGVVSDLGAIRPTKCRAGQEVVLSVERRRLLESEVWTKRDSSMRLLWSLWNFVVSVTGRASKA